MTEKEMIALQTGSIPSPTKIQIPALSNSFKPQGINVFNEGLPLPPQPSDFNRVPISEMEFSHQFKSMDVLHGADVAAKELHRGEGLKALANEVGKEAFQNIYKTLKK